MSTTTTTASRPRLALLAVLLLIATALGIQPAAAAPCPTADCSTVELLSPSAGATLAGTVTLSAAVTQDTADRGEIRHVEWWLYHPSFAEQVPANGESKLLLDESATPSSGSTLDGTWTGSWTVASEVTARDGAYTLGGTRTYQLPADDGQYFIEAHVLDQQWWDDNPAPGGPPGRSEARTVAIDFGGGSGPPPPPPPPAGDVNITGLTLPTSVELLPSGRVYISEKGGAIRTAASLSSSSATTVRTVDTFTNGDHGLQSLAYADGYLYAGYTGQPTGPCNPDDFGQEGAIGCVVHGRIDRFAVNQSTGALGAPSTVRSGPGGWCSQFQTHGIDDLEFGPDGALYVSAGDGAGYSVADTGQFAGDPCGGGGALRAQSRSNLAGNVARVDVGTGAATTVAYGFRNPYRISFRPGSSELFVGDVGWYAVEEVNRVDVSGPVTNHGWPCREGNAPMPVYAGLSACNGVTGTAPIHAYAHDGENAAISAVGFHAGRVYYGDYHRRFIRSITPTGTGLRLERAGVMPVDMLSTPQGLVYVDIAAGAVRSLDIPTTTPSDSPPFADVVVSEQPWTPGQTIDYAIDYRNLPRQPMAVTWTITRSSGAVVGTQSVAIPGENGRQSGSITAPNSTHPETLTFRAVINNSDTGTTIVEASQTRAMAAPSSPPPTSPPPTSPPPTSPPPTSPPPTSPPPSGPAPGEPPPSPAPGPIAGPDTDERPSDIAGNVHREAILRLIDDGIIVGYADNTYRPGNSVTRGQMASLMARTLGLTLVTCDAGGECAGPPDIASSTHASAIRAIVDADIAGGFEDGTYRPDAFVSRAQMATFLANAFDLDRTDPSHDFGDVAENGTHTAAIAAIARAGITLGTTANTYDPWADVRRDQMASFIDRARDLDD